MSGQRGRAGLDNRTYVISGVPRSGTTYISALLHRPPTSITISDPFGAWRRHYARHGAGPEVLSEIEAWRRRIESEEVVPLLPEPALGETPVRVDTWSLTKEMRSVHTTPGFFLGMKNPEIFLGMLPVFLDAGLKVVVSVRDPVAVVNSWVHAAPDRARDCVQGRCALFTSDHADPASRRVELYQYLTGLIAPHVGDPRVCIVRHEAWYDDGLAQLARVTNFLDMPMLEDLRPPPAPPLAIQLPESEVALIRARCTTPAGE